MWPFSKAQTTQSITDTANSWTAWIISDGTHRATQAIYLCEYLDASYLTIEVDDLPKNIHDLAPYKIGGSESIFPDVIFAIGNHTTNAVNSLKKISDHDTTYIHIHMPSEHITTFDLIITPSYEPYAEQENTLTTTGLINKISPELLKNVTSNIDHSSLECNALKNLAHPRIALLVGGKHVHGDITPKNISHLAEWLNPFLQNNKGSITTTNSSRTTLETTNAIASMFQGEQSHYDTKYNRVGSNPYNHMLALADIIIVTTDSVRMVSEACSSGKPVYIAKTSTSTSIYEPLHHELISKGLAKYTHENELSHFKINAPLNEAKRVAQKIEEILQQKAAN